MELIEKEIFILENNFNIYRFEVKILFKLNKPVYINNNNNI